MDPDKSDTVDMLLDVQGTLNIVQMLERNEESLNNLYLTFALTFPQHAAFWNRIANDEHDHATWVSQLFDEVRSKNLTFVKDRFNETQLNDFAEYIARLTERAKEPSFTPLLAAIVSLEVEDTLIERHFFQVFKSDSEILSMTLNKLEASTEEHYRRVREFVQGLKQQKPQ